MNRVVQLGAACLVVVALGTTAFGQGVITDIKTPPSRASDWVNIALSIHNTVNVPNWAGALMQVHLQDATEVDTINVNPMHPTPGSKGGTIDPTGQSQPVMYTVFDPLAPGSGRTAQASINEPVFNLSLHVAGSDPRNNSDTDVTLKFWNIIHLPGGNGVGSNYYTLDPSDYIFVSSPIDDIEQLHITTGPLVSVYDLRELDPLPETGHWIHVPFVLRIHSTGNSPGSQYVARFLNTATIGVEHIPEPTSIILMAGGLVCGVIGLWSRRRRLAN